MATVSVCIGKAGQLSFGNQPVFVGQVRRETITSSGTAASGNLVANEGDIAQIVCETAVIASGVGAASASNGLECPAATPTYLGLTAGAVVSVIDVA